MMGEKADIAAGPQQRTRRKVVTIGGAILAMVLLLGALLGHVVGLRSGDDVLAYPEMWRDHYPPIWKDLALRRITKGDSVRSVLQRHALAQREDAGPYTCLTYFTRGLGQRGVTVLAKDGKLIAARASRQGAQHLFFDSPEQGETFGQAYRKFREQKELEGDAYTIHCAITAGQSVFLSDHVEPHPVPGPVPGEEDMMAQFRKANGDRGDRYLQGMPDKLAVTVDEVLYGDLEPGTILIFRETFRALATSEKVFLHFDDDRALSPRRRGRPAHLTVSKSALEWYRSLTPEQIQALETRRAGK